MESLYSVKLEESIQESRLKVLRDGAGYEDVSIRTGDVNRPGLQPTGLFDYFDAKWLQVTNRVEITYPEGLAFEERWENFELLFPQNIPVLIISREAEPFLGHMEMAEKYDRTTLHSLDTTSVLMSNIIAALKFYLVPSIARHGVLAEVYGEDTLLLSESGMGKSETAIELAKCGHRLVADDAVEIKRDVTDRSVGIAPELIRHCIELRGIGIIDVCHLLGTSAVKDEAETDMIVNLEQWKDGAIYDRLGLGNLYATILDVQVPSLIVPVRFGRNLAVIIEMAATNSRHKKMGYNVAAESTEWINQHFDQAMSVQLNGN